MIHQAKQPKNIGGIIMTINLKAYLEKSLIETWGLTLADLKGKDNEFSYERGCIAYYMIKKGVPIAEIADIFGISTGTIYQYRDRINNEKSKVIQATKYFWTIYGN
jgi:hypothetical protein